jgi:hypothetical protein
MNIDCNTSHAANPLLSLADMSTKMNSTNSTIPRVSWVSQPSRRGTSQLVGSCVITLALCVWTALHLNVPAKEKSVIRRTLHKAKWALFGILAPELVVYTAFVQLISAANLRRWLIEVSKRRVRIHTRN